MWGGGRPPSPYGLSANALNIKIRSSTLSFNLTRRDRWNRNRKGGLLKPAPVKTCFGTILTPEKFFKMSFGPKSSIFAPKIAILLYILNFLNLLWQTTMHWSIPFFSNELPFQFLPESSSEEMKWEWVICHYSLSIGPQKMFHQNSLRKGFKKKRKKVRNFPHFSKPTHPTRKVRKKKIKITWSKNHF